MRPWATAADVLRNQQQPPQPPQPPDEQLDWTGVDWSQQERTARQELLRQQGTGLQGTGLQGAGLTSRAVMDRGALRGALNARVNRDRRARASTLSILPHMASTPQPPSSLPRLPTALPTAAGASLALSRPPRTFRGTSPVISRPAIARPEGRESLTSKGPARRRTVIVRSTTSELNMLLDAEQEASQQEKADLEPEADGPTEPSDGEAEAVVSNQGKAPASTQVAYWWTQANPPPPPSPSPSTLTLTLHPHPPPTPSPSTFHSPPQAHPHAHAHAHPSGVCSGRPISRGRRWRV